jgi:hypothetical protein
MRRSTVLSLPLQLVFLGSCLNLCYETDTINLNPFSVAPSVIREKSKNVLLHCHIQHYIFHYYAECHYAECHYAECHYASLSYLKLDDSEAVFLVVCDPSMNEL